MAFKTQFFPQPVPPIRQLPQTSYPHPSKRRQNENHYRKLAKLISCLTTSNLPWFMNLAFQVPVKYCSLQHQTLFSPSETTINKFPVWPSYFILSGSISNCFHSFLVAYWTPSDLGCSSSGVIFFAFSCHSWCSLGNNTWLGCHFQLTTFC